MNNHVKSTPIEVEVLSNEISQKSILIAKLQANLYELMNENSELKKKLKAKVPQAKKK